MGEGNHTTQPETTTQPRKNLTLIAAGTAIAILGAGVLFQMYRTNDSGGPDRAVAADADSPSSGKVQLGNSSPKQAALAAVTYGDRRYLVSEQDVARECMERVGKEVLDSIINRTVIQLACERHGVTVTEAEVKQKVVDIATDFNIPVDTYYEMLQQERNLTPLQYHRDVIWPMLALRKLAGEEITVTDADLEREFVRLYGQRVKARMIMLSNLRKANEVWKLAMENPEDFGKLARDNSIDPSSRPLDGNIPPIPRYSTSEEIEKAAFKLKEGEISGIIQFGTPARYVILKCEGYTEQRATGLAEVRDVLVREVEDRKTQTAVAEVFERLKEEARVDNFLTGTTTGGIRQTSGSFPNATGLNPPGLGINNSTSKPPTVLPKRAATPATTR